MSSRPTPHGLFAAVAIGTFADDTSITLSADPVLRTRTRSDMGWLSTLLERLEGEQPLRNELPVRRNGLVYRVADRVVLANGLPEDKQQVSVGVTAPVALALRLADGGLRYGQLADELAQRFPRVSQGRIDRLLAQLWDLRIIISDLSAPMTSAVPEIHLAERLATSSDCATVAHRLRRSRELADAVDATRGRARPALLDEFTAHQHRLLPDFDKPTYQTDTALAVIGTGLSTAIAATAAEAGELVVRLDCTRPRAQHIVDYHHAFVERYGFGSEVALLDALSPEKGIGPPNGYLHPMRSHPLPTLPEPSFPLRDQALVDLAVTAARHGSPEVELTDAVLDALTAQPADGPRRAAIPSLDVYAKIAAESRQAIDDGRWRMVLSPGTFQGLQSFGRFADLFDDDLVGRLRRFARLEESRHPDVIFAELNTEPWVPRQGNIMIRPPVREYEISVNAEPALPPHRQIPLSDILVGANGDGFYLRSAALGKRLLVSRSHAVTATWAPNVCRALLELSVDGFAMPSFFDWGPVGNAPFVPRVARGKLVLSPAYWTLSQHRFDGDDPPADPDRFFTAVQSWRQDWRVPRHVYLTMSDHRLLLDLEHPLCVDELHRELRRSIRPGRSGSVRLHEMLPDFSQLWLCDAQGRRYHSELVIPLLADPGETADTPVPAPRQRAGATDTVTRRCLPGDEWTFVKLYTATTQQDDVITGPLRALLARLHADRLIEDWFYIRYADPQPHLRLRFRATDTAAVPTLMSGCAAWAAELVDSGWASDVAFVSYDRELERYGGAEAIASLERVFHANSETTVRLLTMLAGCDLEPDIACVTALHALCRSWGSDPLAYAATRSYAAVPDAGHRRFRAVRPLLCELLVPGQPGPDRMAGRYAAMLAPMLAQQHGVIAEAGDLVRKLAGDGRLLSTERDILESLLHMQANRLLGIDRDSERACRDLWTLAARAIANRPPVRDRVAVR